MAFISGSGRAAAQDYNHVITVYASVPQQRGVYVDQAGNLIKVAGNTTANITPTVFTTDNKSLTMTDAIMNQYQQFLKQHQYHLEAGKIYVINPVTVNSQPNTETIKIPTAKPQPLTLSL